MVDVVVKASERLEGVVSAPPSKAYTHRGLIATLLSKGVSKLTYPLVSDDTKATFLAVRAFGAETDLREDCWMIRGCELLKAPAKPISCGESGATLRFMIPVAALAYGSSTFTAGSSLKKRPIAPLLQSLKQLGTDSDLQLRKEGLVVRIHGEGLRGGRTSIIGDVSSQFITGLLFACPKAKEETEIAITTPLESRSYVQMTIDVLNKHGIKVLAASDFTRLRIPPNQKYIPCDHEVPGDFSSAAFLLAAAAITSSKVKVNNLNRYTTQGDSAILDILEKAGAKIRVGDDFVLVEGGQLSALDVDARDIPDLVPVCAVLACYSKGTSRIFNAKRLRYKESDRLTALQTELKKMDADVLVKEDSLIIRGPCAMRGAVVNPHNDHRIAMACAVAALGAHGKTTIQDSGCVNKSYPRFFDDLYALGAKVVDR